MFFSGVRALMLVWKTQTLNVNVASLRYRCLFPLRYLKRKGVASIICGGADPVLLTDQTQAIIFVKCFRATDVETCEQAYQLGVPIILDLCDNIFIEGYGIDSDYVPAENFRIMAQWATAIVTTGAAMKAEVERSLALLYAAAPRQPGPIVVAIPDGNESIADIKYASRSLGWKRFVSLVQRRIIRKFTAQAVRLARKPGLIGQRIAKQTYKLSRSAYRQSKQRIKCQVYRLNEILGEPLGHYDPSNYGSPDCGSPNSQESQENPAPVEKPCAIATQQRPEQRLDPPPLEIATVIAKQAPNQTPIKANKAASEPCPPKAKSITQPTPFRPQPWPLAPGVKTVLWFGNHGAKYGNFGMLDILNVAQALETLSQEQPLRLMVVSNSREKYEAHIAPLPFATDYLRWHPHKIYDYLRASDVVIVPNSQSAYSICKSANRAVLALSQGTPVVASRTPALEMFAECVWLDDWEEGLRAYLQKPDVAEAHVAQAQAVIAQNLSGEMIAEQWLELLGKIGVSQSSKCDRPSLAMVSTPLASSPLTEEETA